MGSGSLGHGRLNLFATIDDKNKWVSDSLDFRVESNVNYSLEISFEVESSLHQSDRNHINNEYAVKVKDSNNIEIINANKNSNHYGVAQRTLGISTYELIFELFIKNSILQVSGKIGEITITVSSI
ncbi:hypothetical protein X924_09920 [Petrotoga sp. 9PWA.NaAc.5.4]|nr:hypothetical protein X924_09920 [Petrotoga sp. 9PWA.NaAc.5.4]